MGQHCNYIQWRYAHIYAYCIWHNYSRKQHLILTRYHLIVQVHIICYARHILVIFLLISLIRSSTIVTPSFNTWPIFLIRHWMCNIHQPQSDIIQFQLVIYIYAIYMPFICHLYTIKSYLGLRNETWVIIPCPANKVVNICTQ